MVPLRENIGQLRENEHIIIYIFTWEPEWPSSKCFICRQAKRQKKNNEPLSGTNIYFISLYMLTVLYARCPLTLATYGCTE